MSSNEALFLFRCKNFYPKEYKASSIKYQLLVRSSLVTRSSALPDGCQPRPDATLTEPVQLNNFIQLSRGSFAASV